MKFTPTEFKPIPHHPPLRYFKVHPEAFDPIWGTDHASCFDLKACLVAGTPIVIYNKDNQRIESHVVTDSIYVMPGSRVLVPTGIIFNIPLGYDVRFHSRSGLALKYAIVLANHEAVIDSDFIDPSMILLGNDSSMSYLITHGDRIAQGEMVVNIAYPLEETTERPEKKSDRSGGFGSTGVQ